MLSPAPADHVAVATLRERYGISRSVLYGRINALHIELAKLGGRLYLNESIQLKQNRSNLGF